MSENLPYSAIDDLLIERGADGAVPIILLPCDAATGPVIAAKNRTGSSPDIRYDPSASAERLAPSPIHVGDAVRCVDDSVSFNRLREGNTYLVEANYDGSPTVLVRGSSHSLDRFVQVEEERGRQ